MWPGISLAEPISSRCPQVIGELCVSKGDFGQLQPSATNGKDKRCQEVKGTIDYSKWDDIDTDEED